VVVTGLAGECRSSIDARIVHRFLLTPLVEVAPRLVCDMPGLDRAMPVITGARTAHRICPGHPGGEQLS
jgi:hypothetical protein